MDILIKNMEMPTETSGIEIFMYNDGRTICRNIGEDRWVEVEAIPVPEHGDLIDRDDLANSIPEAEPHGFENCEKCTCMTKDEMVEIILDAEVVLERTT